MTSPRISVRVVLILLAAVATTIVTSLRHASQPGAASGGTTSTSAGNEAFLAAVNAHAHDRLVTVRAAVLRVLSDDREGSPHQRFLLSVSGGPTVLVAHNIALAKRVPVEVGDTVLVAGEYVWTPKGGTLHWTHLDPAGNHQPGYVELRGHRYQ